MSENEPRQAETGFQPLPSTIYRRTVFLGDSITDGNTYSCLVRDALADAGLPPMAAINAGIGGNTAAEMLTRLDRDVLVHNPTLVTFSSAGNDSARGVTPEAYDEAVKQIIVCMEQAGVPLILLTPVIVRPRGAGRTPGYDEALRRLSAVHGLRLADVGARMREGEAAGQAQFAPDGHPNYTGQRTIARAVLDALGYPDVSVPIRIHASLQPGVITPWKVRPTSPDEAPLTAETAANLKPDAGWVTIDLPEPEPLTADEDLWLDDCRLQGAAVGLKQKVGGETGRYIAAASLHSKESRNLLFHTGAELARVWLNGHLMYENDWKHGWHLGRQSIGAAVKQGENRLVIEAGGVFFLSATENGYWE